MTSPIVGVIIPAYNAAAFLHQALDSVLAQSLDDWKVVVVDDGSTDTTREVAESYQNRDARIQVLSGPNVGLPAARNKGLAALSTRYIAFLDADDIWLPNLLEKLVGAAQQHDVALVACHTSTFRHDPDQRTTIPVGGSAWGTVLEPQALARELRRICFFMPSGVLVESSLLRKVGGFDEALTAVEDWDLWLRLADHGASAFVFPEPLYLRRYHETNHSSNLDLMFRYNFLVMKRHSVGKGRPATDFRAAARLQFRNTLTLLGDAGDVPRAVEMFEDYREHDADGYACRTLHLLKAVLPTRLFWLVARFAVIPLAWHLEALGERRPRSRRDDNYPGRGPLFWGPS